MRIPRALALALLLGSGLVAGCGGGSDTAQPGVPGAVAFDVQAAAAALFGRAARYELTGHLSAAQTGGAPIEFHETDVFVTGAPPDPAVGDFPATELTRTTWSSTDTTPRSRAETYYYTQGPFRLAARKRDGSILRFTVVEDFPTRASVGQSGQFATGKIDQSSGSEDLFWSVEAADAPETAWVCFKFIQIRTRYSQCVRVAANGAILGGRVVHDTSGLGGPVIDLR